MYYCIRRLISDEQLDNVHCNDCKCLAYATSAGITRGIH